MSDRICPQCERPMAARGEPLTPGLVRWHGGMFCDACRQRARRAGARTPKPPAPSGGSTEWVSRAACGGIAVDTFFPPDNLTAETREAKAICRTCPVRADCLQYALNNPELIGVWGGTNATERYHMRRRANA